MQRRCGRHSSRCWRACESLCHPHLARARATPDRAPWPARPRPTNSLARQNAAAIDAWPKPEPAPPTPPSAQRSCTPPAATTRCNSHETEAFDPRDRKHSSMPKHKPQIDPRSHLRIQPSHQPTKNCEFVITMSGSFKGGSASFSGHLQRFHRRGRRAFSIRERSGHPPLRGTASGSAMRWLC